MASPIFPHLAKPVKLIVLDRDGVINEDSDAYVKSVAEWIPIPGSLQAIGQAVRAPGVPPSPSPLPSPAAAPRNDTDRVPPDRTF